MTLFELNPTHYGLLEATVNGYLQTGVPLIAIADASLPNDPLNVMPAGYSMSLGSYIIIPGLKLFSGFSLNSCINIVYGGSVILAYILGIIGCWFYCKTNLGKTISLVGISILSFIIAGIWDFHIYYGISVLAIVPLWLFLEKRKKLFYSISFLFFSGLLIGICHYMRSHSGTSVVIFILMSLLLSKNYCRKNKLLCLLSLLFGFLVIYSSFMSLIKQRDNYLTKINTPYILTTDRPFWNQPFASLGYLSNNYAFEGWNKSSAHEYGDHYVDALILHKNPNIKRYSEEFYMEIKKEYFNFIKEHPWFYIQSHFAKLGVLFLYIIIFGNIGLVLSFLFKVNIKFKSLFFAGIFFNMLFGLVTSPQHRYLIGLFAFVTLYNVLVIDMYLARRK